MHAITSTLPYFIDWKQVIQGEGIAQAHEHQEAVITGGYFRYCPL